MLLVELMVFNYGPFFLAVNFVPILTYLRGYLMEMRLHRQTKEI